MQDLNYHTLPPFPLTPPTPNFLLHSLIPLFAYTPHTHTHTHTHTVCFPYNITVITALYLPLWPTTICLILHNYAYEWYTYFIYITTQSSTNCGTFIHYCDLPSLSSNMHQAPIPSNTSTSKIPPRIPPAIRSHLWPVMVVYCELWNHTYCKSENFHYIKFSLEKIFVLNNFHRVDVLQKYFNTNNYFTTWHLYIIIIV